MVFISNLLFFWGGGVLMSVASLFLIWLAIWGLQHDPDTGARIGIAGIGVAYFLLMIPLWRSIYTYLRFDKNGVTEKCPLRKPVEYPFSEFEDCGVVVYYDIPLIYLSKQTLTYGQKGGNRQRHELIKWGEDAIQISYTKRAVRAIRTYAPPELYEKLCRDIDQNPHIKKKYR